MIKTQLLHFEGLLRWSKNVMLQLFLKTFRLLFQGLGGGMTLKFCVGHSVHLSVLYSASKQERENRGDQNRLHQNKMLQVTFECNFIYIVLLYSINVIFINPQKRFISYFEKRIVLSKLNICFKVFHSKEDPESFDNNHFSF